MPIQRLSVSHANAGELLAAGFTVEKLYTYRTATVSNVVGVIRDARELHAECAQALNMQVDNHEVYVLNTPFGEVVIAFSDDTAVVGRYVEMKKP